MPKLSRLIILLGLVLITVFFSYSVWQKEQTLANGSNILIHLAPVDPRSLMQGDYMILNYDISRKIEEEAKKTIEGNLVYTLNDKNVVSFKRVFKAEEVLQKGEKLLLYRHRRRGVQVGSNSFFFQEGKAKNFESAKYGELRVDSKGHTILVGLRDKDLLRLGLTSGL
ncbi:MAG: GDYXXLXY domain-containing protein [Thiotrichaceae bacterium]|nr:GDYXXLXY domain-containing protein [Thiotrichaceae bacterium]